MKQVLIIILVLSVISCKQPVKNANGYPSVTLKNKLVRLNVYLPDTVNGYYRSTRFDWSGIISDFEYQGNHYFGEWKTTHDPLNHDDITGPCEGYLFPGPGFDEASPGESFLRIGVGALIRPDTLEYEAFKTYEFSNHGNWETRYGKDWVEFSHTVSIPSGYGYIYTKKIELLKKEPGFVIRHLLKNTGSKTIETDQFNHNFFVINNAITGPDFRISFPFQLVPELVRGNPDVVTLENNQLLFAKELNTGYVWLKIAGAPPTPEAHNFTIYHDKSQTAIMVEMDQNLQSLIFWARSNVISPENFINIHALPGEEFIWNSTYRVVEYKK